MPNKVRKIPMRMCVVSREKLPKKELIRIVRTDNGVIIDETGKANGRGAYVKKDIAVIEKAEKTKVLDKHLEVNVPTEIYEQLKEMINEAR